MITSSLIREKTAHLIKELTDIRHHLHQNPELSFHERETAAYISQLLTSWGIDHQTGIAGHGIVGVIKGQNPGKRTIALRADMDALPITEANQVPYKSMRQGVMHACGHDVHMTCLLGTIKLLNSLKADFNGSVKFIFQPAEETLPGGAQQMIIEGVLKNPDVEMILGQHVFPELEAGMAGFKSGDYMASSDEINLIITGRGGHGAMPEKFNDTVLAMAQIIVALQQIVSRKAPTQIPTVLSFGKVIADGAHNVIPSEVIVRGTFRTFDERWRTTAHQLIETIAHHTAVAFGVRCEVVIDKGYPVVINHPEETKLVREAAIEFLGLENVVELEIRTTAEDFGYFLQQIPGCFYRLGTRNQSLNITSNLHTDTFNIDEKAIETGTGLMTWLALQRLEK
ncbi:MAG: N-acyl-L-amino acid amidohydrolase [Bacteroidetes bacterium GWF2_41_31]|nr:MAG: N-acyl-L-amino acid amidohydrolase [Bacteroidetes bacterium GWF2_41_31]OFZ06594.1 MAG: N-acyl-L-amino acid amidohydrolase [Bacteroidetes bacterium RIFOXYB12_FULL_41_6]